MAAVSFAPAPAPQVAPTPLPQAAPAAVLPGRLSWQRLQPFQQAAPPAATVAAPRRHDSRMSDGLGVGNTVADVARKRTLIGRIFRLGKPKTVTRI